MVRSGWRGGAYLVEVVALATLAVVSGGTPSRDAQPSVAEPSPSPVTSVAATSAPATSVPPSDPATVLATTPVLEFDSSAVAPAASVSAAPAPATAAREPANGPTRRVVAYDGKLAPGWSDLGWSTSRVINRGPAKIDMGATMGWIVARRGRPLDATSVQFRYRTPRPLGAVLQVTLGSATVEQTSEIAIANLDPDSQGWYSVSITIRTLNPKAVPYDRIRIRPTRSIPGPLVIEIDKLVFIEPVKATATTAAAKRTANAKPAKLGINCADVRHRISPLIYGVAYSGASNQKEIPWTIGATVNRWGGNPTSRYNWQVPNAWNTANDYYFRNVAINDAANASEYFLGGNELHGLRSALTVPMLGWVAKDTTSYSFPVSKYGPQQSTDPYNADIGNGVAPDGRKLESGSPQMTSTASSPELIGQWVATLKGRVSMYFLDNEPELWDSTHRDVHPEPLTYDELLDKTLRYASAVRSADRDAVIAGPSSWGWPAYFWSAADAKAGFRLAPDRRAHGNMPLIPWYLKQVRAAEERSGRKLLDVLDVHFYPAAERVYEGGVGATDPATSALRIRQVRGLWDPTYKDESWVGESIHLIPRLRAWIDQYAPGVGISIGEWNFGGENHMSGALATAEALGRFGLEGVTAAYYWTNPPVNSPSYWAFRAYRNFDGKGGQFLDRALGTSMAPDMSLFASTNAGRSEITAIVLNTSPTTSRTSQITLEGCGRATSSESFLYSGAASVFAPQGVRNIAGNSVNVTLPPYTIAVVRIAVG